MARCFPLSLTMIRSRNTDVCNDMYSGYDRILKKMQGTRKEERVRIGHHLPWRARSSSQGGTSWCFLFRRPGTKRSSPSGRWKAQ